jgi:DnaK suppressor protein
MDPSQLQRYHKLLTEKQRELLSVQSNDLAPVPAAGGLEGDVVDQANADAEAELQIHLHESDGRLLIAIEEALARMRQGTYGVCVVCKEPITKARLEAVPWTHLCRECKERQAA